jgi:hypothetical protein
MIMRGETMNALIGTRHEVNITYPALDETLQGTPTAVPAAEPATAQISYTVSAVTHLPTVDSSGVVYSYTGQLAASGLNLTASARVISYRILKNTVSLTTGTYSCVASQYWTLRLYHSSLTGIVAGDVIEVKLWCADATWLNWDYNYFAVSLSRIKPVNDTRKCLFNVQLTDGAVVYPIATLGSAPTNASTTTDTIFGAESTVLLTLNSASNGRYHLLKENSTNGILKRGAGDGTNTSGGVSHATAHPYYWSGYKITKIQWNELDMRI